VIQSFDSRRGDSCALLKTHPSEPRRNAPKVDRNRMCPRRSGKKYKRCCGGAGVDGEFRVRVTILLLFSVIIPVVLAAVDFVNLRRVP
jgi:hypothetical protein